MIKLSRDQLWKISQFQQKITIQTLISSNFVLLTRNDASPKIYINLKQYENKYHQELIRTQKYPNPANQQQIQKHTLMLPNIDQEFQIKEGKVQFPILTLPTTLNSTLQSNVSPIQSHFMMDPINDSSPLPSQPSECDKKRNNQNANREIIRKMAKFVHKELCHKKCYRSKNFGSEDRRQILAIFRFVCNKEGNCRDKLDQLKKYLYDQYSNEVDKLLKGQINKNNKQYKIAHLISFLIALQPNDLSEDNLQSTLFNLFKIGQLKQHSPNISYLLRSYLIYQKQIFDVLLQ